VDGAYVKLGVCDAAVGFVSSIAANAANRTATMTPNPINTLAPDDSPVLSGGL
jgi:hypothetical protein